MVELFEARTPKGKATLARQAGVVRIRDDGSGDRTVVIVENDGTEHDCRIGSEYRLEVRDGDEVEPGDALVEGPRDPKELLEIRGIDATQRYLVAEVQSVYRDQGVSIHDKHIELIVRQMTKRVAIGEPGDTHFLPDERVDKASFEQTNREIVRASGRPASGRREVMGITKASLATESWLSAASFQETTRVLTEAAIESKRDTLVGLKENIIIGKLIPAGTGMTRYREGYETHAPDHTPMDYYSSEDDLADLLAQRSHEMAGAEVLDYPVASPPARSPRQGDSPSARPDHLGWTPNRTHAPLDCPVRLAATATHTTKETITRMPMILVPRSITMEQRQ